MPQVSIIIRTFNEEARLPELLAALECQTLRDFEIVVVDSGSFDRTLEIARRQADRLFSINRHDFTFGYSLNVGIRGSSGRLVVIVSAHTVPVSEDWLERITAPFTDPDVAMVYGRQQGRHESKFSECLDFERSFGPHPKTLRPPDCLANNANSAVRREFWQQHPFDESLPGLEDAEWAQYWVDRNFKVVYEPAASIYHIHTESWRQVQHRYYREGQAAHWIGIRGRRHTVAEVMREGLYFSSDVFYALRGRRLWSTIGEIVRFRGHKLVGTLRGIWTGAKMENPMERERVLFQRDYSAFVIQGPGKASLTRVPSPELRPSEVLIRVAYEAICATDLEILDGHLGYYKNGLAHYPITPGHEFSGTIAAIGARVDKFKVGDPVVVECIQGCGDCAACLAGNAIGCLQRAEVGVIGRNGGYAEYMVTAGRFVHRIADGASLRSACLCEPIAVVLKGLRKLDTVIAGSSRHCGVVGAGPIGHLAAQLLHGRGHRVTVYDRNPQRLKLFDGSPIETDQDLASLAQVDALVEATGDPEALDFMLHLSRPGATLLLLGLPYARREFSFEAVVGYDKTVIGSVGSTAIDFAEAACLLPKLKLDAFFQKIIPFSQVESALALARTGQHLKIILEVDAAAGEQRRQAEHERSSLLPA